MACNNAPCGPPPSPPPPQNDAPQWQSAILTRGALCKKGFLCMLRLYRANRDSVDVDEWIARFITMLEDNHELGIVNAVMSVVLAFASADTTKIAQVCALVDIRGGSNLYRSRSPTPLPPSIPPSCVWRGQIIPTVSSLLHRLAVRRTCPSDYLYYAVPCPWIQVQCSAVQSPRVTSACGPVPTPRPALC